MTDCVIWVVDDDADDIYLIEQGFRECSFNVRTFSPPNVTEVIPALEKTYTKDLPQVFVAIDLRQLSNSSQIPKVIEQIIHDYRQSVPQKKGSPIVYPGERILRSREENLEKGIPVIKTLWDKIVQL